MNSVASCAIPLQLSGWQLEPAARKFRQYEQTVTVNLFEICMPFDSTVTMSVLRLIKFHLSGVLSIRRNLLSSHIEKRYFYGGGI